MNVSLTRVVIGVDFSSASRAAAEWVARSFAPDAHIVLVHALDVRRPPAFLEAVLPPHAQTARAAREQAEALLQELVDELPDGRCRAEVREGRPAEQLNALAAELKADVIALGPHGERRTFPHALGSTADRVAHSAAVPVLVVRDPGSRPPSHLLVAIDDSPHAAGVLAWAARLQNAFDVPATAVFVLEPYLSGRVALISSDRASLRFDAGVREAAEAWLRDTIPASPLDDERTRHALLTGSPAHAVVSAVESQGADLVVAGSRGSGAVAGTMLGSVARSILRLAPCPVLLVREREG